jgi:uncharacterized protein DUF4276
MPIFGLIVEGVYDAAAITEWIRRCLPGDVDVIPRLYAQKGSLMRKFPTYLSGFHWDNQGGPVDKAFVIRDADGKDPQALINVMKARIAGRLPIFPVAVMVIVQELETWLLADHEAVSRVTGMRMSEIHGALEEMRDPKQRLQRVLSDASVAYTAEVARKIAATSDLEKLAYRCPSFRIFHQAVRDP